MVVNVPDNGTSDGFIRQVQMRRQQRYFPITMSDVRALRWAHEWRARFFVRTSCVIIN